MEREETASAIVERVDPDLVICRYKHGVKVNAAAVEENLEARLRFPGKEPYAVIGIFPGDVDFDMSLLEHDHYTGIALNQITRVLAIVAEDELFDPIARLYFAYHPTGFNSRVFHNEEDARTWVNARIQCVRETGGFGDRR
ncbi:MAG: hypothetical protein IPO60_03070 [Flavobacteriales bacterium]|jgi:hypothetical protein|nr:hypothetical protein [Flavobacteriales bacterium]MBK6892151.1 hypothetical protein [Flavobacteriales bacterium]MBK7286130.1 hypothetical protein [Flavobacteriales bacterium]MBK9597322.1 hypothetical protein [Flavobacteriales bacterium]